MKRGAKGYKLLVVPIPRDAYPAVEEWLRVGYLLTGSKKKAAVLLAGIADTIVEWRAEAARGER